MSLIAPRVGETISSKLAATAEAMASKVTFVDASGNDEPTDLRQLDLASSAVARRLRARGIGRGDRVAFVGFTARPLVEALLGAWKAGAAVVMLPIPLRLKDADAHRANMKVLVESARVKLVVADGFFAELLEGFEVRGAAVVSLEALASGDEVAVDDAPLPSDLALLQLTSGSSGAPKAVCLTHAALCANMESIADGTRLTPADHVVSWLPLYHDMGLIGGLLVPLAVGCGLSSMPPHAFMMRPAMWMDVASRHGGTVLIGPNFAYALAARAMANQRGLDLSRLRLAFCGAEPIVPSDLEGFLAAGKPHGMPPTILLPCYGLAEASLAVTIAPPARRMVVDRVARLPLEREGRAIPAGENESAKQVVGLGRPLRALSVRVVDDSGNELPERTVGEVWVSGASLLARYEIDGTPANPLENGWLRTGDLGYLVGGELFLCGRKKDLMIVRGRNLWPDDVERAAETVSGVRRGNACAFSVDDETGHETIVLVAEKAKDASETGVASAVLSAVTEAIGVAPRHVVLLAPAALPKTSSGKLRRQVTKASYLAGELESIEEAGAALPRAGGKP